MVGVWGCLGVRVPSFEGSFLVYCFRRRRRISYSASSVRMKDASNNHPGLVPQEGRVLPPGAVLLTLRCVSEV